MIHAALSAFRKKTLSLLLAAATAVLPVKSIAYSPGTIERIPGTKISLPCGTVTEPGTHPLFTEASIRFYQQSREFQENSAAREILNNPARLQAMINGSIKEDSPEACFIRAYNHFSDWEKGWGIFSFKSSPLWAQNEQAQQGEVPLDNFLHSGKAWTVPLYPLYNAVLEKYQGLYPEGNHAWDKAVRERDFESLGHLLHLLQDATVPAHVRNDPHAFFPAGVRYVSRTDLHEDSYEQWAQDHPEAFATLTPQRLRRVNSLDELFAEVIQFTGSHFFSDNSIPLSKDEESLYSSPQVRSSKREGWGKTYYYDNLSMDGTKIPIARKGFLSPYVLDRKVLEGQFLVLGTKAVEMGAAAIDLFFRTIEAQQPGCQSHADKTCVSSNVYWRNSCGQLEEVAEECSLEEYCDVGACTSRLVEIAFVSMRDGNRDIYVMNEDGSNQRRLTDNTNNNFHPVWSPDGKQIAFLSDREYEGYEIYIMNADGSNQRRVTNIPYYKVSPTWSPDGKQIAFISAQDGFFEIYIMNADGSNQRKVTNTQDHKSDPTWSPDGRQIAFVSGRDGNNEIYVMNTDGSDQRRLTNNDNYDDDPTWSPDSRQIAFTSDRERIRLYEIYAMNADGSEQRNLTNNNAQDSIPDWSSDGRQIAFTSERDGNSEIYVMNTDGSDQRRLTNNDASDSDPNWRPR